MKWPWERDPPPEPEGDPEATPGTDDDLLSTCERILRHTPNRRWEEPK